MANTNNNTTETKVFVDPIDNPKGAILTNVVNALREKGASEDIIYTLTDSMKKELSNYVISGRDLDNSSLIYTNKYLIDRYCHALESEGKSEKTIDLYRHVLNNFSREIKLCPFISCNHTDIKFYMLLKQDTTSNRTSENYRMYLHSFFKWMVEEEFISKNPVKKIKSIKYHKKERYILSDVEINKLRETLNSLNNKNKMRNRAIFEVLLSSGIRVSELCDLKINDIDFDDNAIHILNGKGGRGRFTFINTNTMYYLKEYLKSRTDKSPYLFISNKSETIDPETIRDMLNKLADKADVENVHPHRFRRTFATNLWNKGMELHTIQILMGHESLNTTIIYLAHNYKKIREQYMEINP